MPLDSVHSSRCIRPRPRLCGPSRSVRLTLTLEVTERMLRRSRRRRTRSGRTLPPRCTRCRWNWLCRSCPCRSRSRSQGSTMPSWSAVRWRWMRHWSPLPSSTMPSWSAMGWRWMRHWSPLPSSTLRARGRRTRTARSCSPLAPPAPPPGVSCLQVSVGGREKGGGKRG
eukprot:3445529-Rhodomonas_salina.1